MCGEVAGQGLARSLGSALGSSQRCPRIKTLFLPGAVSVVDELWNDLNFGLWSDLNFVLVAVRFALQVQVCEMRLCPRARNFRRKTLER